MSLEDREDLIDDDGLLTDVGQPRGNWSVDLSQPKHAGLAAGALIASLLLGCFLTYFLACPSGGQQPADDPPPPIFASVQERNAFFLQALEGTEADLRSDAAHITAKPHLAGTSDELELAEWMAQRFRDLGLPSVQTQGYSLLLPFPNTSRVEITHPPERRWVARNEEEQYAADATSDPRRNVAIFNGYSASGVAEGEVVYVNYGREEDFAYVLSSGVELTGRIVLVRYGEIFRANKCQMAEQHGAAGCLVYSDPADDGFARGAVYSDGPWRPASGVQRGTMWIGNGDPLTPGWPSLASAPRLTDEQLHDAAATDEQPLPGIPIHPLSWSDAAPILAGLAGGPATPAAWRGAVPNVSYALGPGPVRVRMAIEQTLTRATVHQVVGMIPGSVEPDRWVVLGAHRDAWDLGAMDPGSGTITLLNVARGLGRMLAHGWKPRRSVLLISHGAEEQGLLGSCEWVETHRTLLEQRGVAYFNVDIAVDGRQYFSPSGTPSIERLLRRAAAQVPAPPDQQPAKRTVLDMWDPDMAIIDALGSGSDFTAFQQHAGLVAADLQFVGAAQGYRGVYHSNYDSMYWLEHFGDPGFVYHVAIARVLGLAALHAADDALLDIDYTAYPPALLAAVQQSQRNLAAAAPPRSFDFAPLERAIRQLNATAYAVQQQAAALPLHDAAALRAYNDRLMLAERTFIHFPRAARGWYAHALFSPGRYDSYASDAFPVLGDCIHDRDWPGVDFQIKLLTTIIQVAAQTLGAADLPPFYEQNI